MLTQHVQTLLQLNSLLAQAGFEGVDMQVKGEVLVLQLPTQEAQGKLLAESRLREALVKQAAQAGFARVAIELTA